MSVKIEYVAWAPAGGWERQIDNIALAVGEEIRENAGFLKVEHRETREVFYYNHKCQIIFGDLSQRSLFGVEEKQEGDLRNYVENCPKGGFLKVGCLPARRLRKKEYEIIFQSEEYEKRWEQKGWLDIRNINAASAGSFSALGQEPQKEPLIPVYDCKGQRWKIGQNAKARDMTIQFILHGMFPAACLEIDDRLWRELLYYIENTYDTSGVKKKWPGSMTRSADEERLREIKEYYCKKDFYAAGLPVYSDTIFQEARGSWDLHSFAGQGEGKFDDKNAIFYKVKGLYARNPMEDVAAGTEQAAIDFGTRSTTVAVLDNSGNITLMPVGTMEAWGASAFENPTILEFKNIRRFMEDYRKAGFRPDTKLDDISVSYQAMADYKKPAEQTGIQMRQYMNHLKQWVNAPGDVKDVVDSKEEKFRLEHESFPQPEGELNPIEIYAYYIGRNLNNMHHQKVYLRYLLSYTSTYTEKKREWIRKSFEKGLKKSLPPEIGNNEELMKGFEVKLGCDEATAYAVSALERYIEEDYCRYEEDSIYISQLEEGGIFYGVYDFGGGTLDFSFGIMKQEGEQDVFRKLKYGGSSNLGCENFLEELAFEIFCREENRKILSKYHIKCEKPFLYGALQNGYQIVGDSNAARFNTSSMIAYLREFWINEKKGQEFWLQSEEGIKYHAKLGDEVLEKSRGKNRNIELQMCDEDIEYFFCEKVTRGVRQFIQYYKEVVKDNKWLKGKLCFLFLAGNASRAKRVAQCFYRELETEGLTKCFSIKPPLPTESDRERYLRHSVRSIPTAKSGVAFGLLRARQEAADIKILDETAKLHFRYHIGVKKRDRRYMVKGLFRLLLSAEEISSAYKEYRFLMKIPQKDFLILYTSDGGYALASDRLPVGDEVREMEIHIPEYCAGSFLYVRIKENTAEELELGVSDIKEKYQSKVEKAGICDFAKGRFKQVDYEEK